MTGISLLSITNRPKHATWLRWNQQRLRTNLEAHGHDVQVHTIMDTKNRTVGALRNAAMEHAEHEWMAWVDDDDWYRPDRFEYLFERAVVYDESAPAFYHVPWVAHTHCHMWAIQKNATSPRLVQLPINGCAIYKTALARTIPYDEARKPASDVRWLRKLQTAYPQGKLLVDTSFHTLLGLHGVNYGNKTQVAGCRAPMSRVEAAVGLELWGDSAAQMEAFRKVVA